MITRSKAKEVISMPESDETKNTVTMDDKLKIPVFTGEGQLSVKNWLLLFERATEKKTEERKKILLEYLSERALNYFIEENMFEEDWENIKIKLINYFSEEKIVSSQQFINLKLEDCNNIEEYYRKKTDAARKLKVDEIFLMELLTNGLPRQQKILNFTKTFSTANEWYHFNKELYYNLKEENAEKKFNNIEHPRRDQVRPLQRAPFYQNAPRPMRMPYAPPSTPQFSGYRPPSYGYYPNGSQPPMWNPRPFRPPFPVNNHQNGYNRNFPPRK